MRVIGQSVGPFEIVEPVWVPEPGRWYLARATSGDSALVRLAGNAEDERAAISAQHRVLLALDDPRIPAVVARDERLGAIALAAGLGTPLTEAIAQRIDESIVLTPATLIDLLLQVASAVEHAQSRRVVHGHLDPDQVVIGPDGQIWVFGYGVDATPLPAWTAPERVALGPRPAGPPVHPPPATEATDVWSICAIGLGLVLGHPPFRNAEQARSGDASHGVKLVTGQWPALGRVLGRGLEPAPADRYPSVEYLRIALKELELAAGRASDRASVGATLWARRSLTFRAMVRSAPTVVPYSDAGEERGADPTDSLGWFGGAPTPTPAPRAPPLVGPEVTSVVPRPMLTPEDATLGNHEPPGVRSLPIVRLAPILAGAMVVLLIVWLITQLS